LEGYSIDKKFCSNCGAEIDAKAEICPKCGVRVRTSGSNEVEKIKQLSTGKKIAIIIGFCFGIIPGVILYLIWRP
jgi:predicted amidophosphoribosyltransferase